MILDFVPAIMAEDVEIAVYGDVLEIDGVSLDFSELEEGEVLPRSAVAHDLIGSSVTRTDGVVRLTLVLPCGRNAPPERRFPASITTAGDGPVTLPPFGTE